MVTVTAHAGVCRFGTTITAKSEDGQDVALSYETTCPHAQKARAELTSVGAYAETRAPRFILSVLSELPHSRNVHTIEA
jgi:hypothetical protein